MGGSPTQEDWMLGCETQQMPTSQHRGTESLVDPKPPVYEQGTTASAHTRFEEGTCVECLCLSASRLRGASASQNPLGPANPPGDESSFPPVQDPQAASGVLRSEDPVIKTPRQERGQGGELLNQDAALRSF